jgi:hypothetical protein
MHRLFLVPAVLAGTLALGCDSTGTPTAPSSATTEPSFSLTAQHFTNRTQFEETAVASCTGDELTLVGELSEALTIVSDEVGALHVTDNVVIQAVATGSVTGAQYVFHDVFQFHFNSPNGAAVHFTQTVHETAHNITKGSLDNRLFRFDIHVTVTGQGIEKTTVDNFTAVCVG